ncbi:hypothetical protein NLJ89_g7887 [Agrocybe chaxingu]|uniref:Uncharacterized protein n=1 Tax=Agrocybe chaxingu TaxID=84603 RepID=A0A9W8JYD7_9AGAR|nr:hypothetical protein NLJ89_g7887 [Agrocybe chaxingu]
MRSALVGAQRSDSDRWQFSTLQISSSEPFTHNRLKDVSHSFFSLTERFVAMLTPPLSLLAQEILDYIVDHVVLPHWDEDLVHLSLTDRVFTARCQMQIFRKISLDDDDCTKSEMKKKIKKKWDILKASPWLAKHIRIIILRLANPQLFDNLSFVKILNLMTQSCASPHTLEVETEDHRPKRFAAGLLQSSLFQTLTTIHLTGWKSLPLDVIVVCSNLKNLNVRNIDLGDERKHHMLTKGFPPPKIERFDYCNSHHLVRRLIKVGPPTAPIVDWCQCKILEASPHERSDMSCVQRILKLTSHTLEEFYLTTYSVSNIPEEKRQFPLKTLVNLELMSNLRIFRIYAAINCRGKQHTVLDDISAVLSSMPSPNRLQCFFLRVSIYGGKSFKDCLDEDWEGLCIQVVRVSGGRSLSFRVEAFINPHKLDDRFPGDDILYASLEERMKRFLSPYRNVKFHFLFNERKHLTARNLALADRSFTARCQIHIFRELFLEDDWDETFKSIVERKWKILDGNPSLARLVRIITFNSGDPKYDAIFTDVNFMKIMGLITQFANQFHTLRLQAIGQKNLPGARHLGTKLVQSGLAQTLTTLYIENWTNFPLDIFSLCSNLKDLKAHHIVPRAQAPLDSRSDLLKLERLEYDDSEELMKKLLGMPDVHNSALVTASGTVQDIILYDPIVPDSGRSLPLGEFIDLKSTKNLEAFTVSTIINCRVKHHDVLRDLSIILATLPSHNQMRMFSLDISVVGARPFKQCLDEDWEGICAEIVRISANKSFSFSLFIGVEYQSHTRKAAGEGALYESIEGRIRASLKDYPNVNFSPLNNITRWELL